MSVAAAANLSSEDADLTAKEMFCQRWAAEDNRNALRDK